MNNSYLVRFVCLVLVSATIISAAVDVDAQQQPTPSPTPRTGRSYNSREPPRRLTRPAPQATSPVQFTDITAVSGVAFRHAASPTLQKYLLETMGAGVALLDYDNDGRVDLYFTNGARLDDPMPKGAIPDKRDPRFWNRLYRQLADGKFEDVTERAGVQGVGYCMGVAAGDYNGDGFADLYVTAYGGGVLYRNNRDGTFTDVMKGAGVAINGWATSAGWLDYNRDGRLDLFVARYMEWDFERGALYCGEPPPGYRSYCHPDNFSGAANILFRQKADETFEDVTQSAGLSAPDGKALGVAFADFDADGWTDIFVAHDSVRQSLHLNKADETFEDIALEAGVSYDENGKTFAGMGVDAADYDNDGRPDLLITALSNETYPLFRNNGDNTFNYTTNTTGINQVTLLYTGWGTRFVDADNDGWRDIFVAQGHVLDTIERTTNYLQYKQTPLLMRNMGKTFVNVSATAGAPFSKSYAARGAAFGDLDNDGDTDIVISETNGAPVILRNDGTKNHWLGLSLAGKGANKSGIGARVTVVDAAERKQIFDISTAGSYLSSNDPRVIVGLGHAAGVRSVEVRWPSGKTQTFTNLTIDRYHVIRER
ncbi:hypothetical protein BH18ACI4_BH18ACI4_12390 [soil metagenome]